MVSELSWDPRQPGLLDPLVRMYSAKSSSVFWLYPKPPGLSGLTNGTLSVSRRKPRNHVSAVARRSRSACSYVVHPASDGAVEPLDQRAVSPVGGGCVLIGVGVAEGGVEPAF